MQVAIGLVDLKDRKGGSILDVKFGGIDVYERTIGEDGSFTYSQL